MDRVYESGASATPPTPPAIPSTGYPSRGNTSTGAMPTVPGPYMMHQLVEEIMAVIAAGGIVADKTVLNQLKLALDATYLAKNGGSPILQNFAGLTRSVTPVGGGLVREYVDIANAATVGGIEISIVYNCAIDPVTGVWAGRDIADMCWLEKWHDAAGTKEFWYAPTAAAGAVPVWTKIFAIDMVNGTVTLPTPAQFDNSTKAATTAFVQAIGLRAAGAESVYTATATMPATDAGKTINIASLTAGLVVTLPLASSMPVGSILNFVCYGSSFPVTVARQGADVVRCANLTALTSFVFNPGDTLTLQVTSAGGFDVIGGSLALVYAGIFGAALTAAGYQKLPGGLIIQWGQVTATTTPTNYSFPIAFPTGCQGISCGSNMAASNIAIAPVSTSQYSVTAASGTPGGRWIAIGF